MQGILRDFGGMTGFFCGEGPPPVQFRQYTQLFSSKLSVFLPLFRSEIVIGLLAFCAFCAYTVYVNYKMIR